MGESADDLRQHDPAIGRSQHSDVLGENRMQTSSTSGTEQELEGRRAEVEHLRSNISETIDAIQEKLTPEHLAQEAVVQARQQVRSQKERIAGGVENVAGVLRQTGEQLRAQDQGTIAEYANNVAEQVDRVSGYLRERDVRELVNEVEQFARRQPVLFVGAAFALGLLGARFLKSSSQQGAAMSRPGVGTTGRAGY
ncbi:MAG: hypothetical protein CYG59_02545, partial [Chloroflexi bacterium]